MALIIIFTSFLLSTFRYIFCLANNTLLTVYRDLLSQNVWKSVAVTHFYLHPLYIYSVCIYSGVYYIWCLYDANKPNSELDRSKKCRCVLSVWLQVTYKYMVLQFIIVFKCVEQNAYQIEEYRAHLYWALNIWLGAIGKVVFGIINARVVICRCIRR